MKIIPLSKARANLRRYARLSRKETVVVTIDGIPDFRITPLNEKDDLVDRLIETNAEFRELLKKRLNEPTMPIKEAIRRLS
jgi:hypothetical protein